MNTVSIASPEKATGMTENWSQRTEREIAETLPQIRRLVEEGLSPTDAINRAVERSPEVYLAALREYGLSPDIPD